MPELPEVENVKNNLKKQVLDKKIVGINIFYPALIEYPNIEEFKKNIINQTINDIKRRGKWLMFELDQYFLLSHLRMEGKYLIRKKGDLVTKHELISFLFSDDTELRYQDVRKFGKMHLIKKDEVNIRKPICELGLEPWDKNLTTNYLKEKFSSKKVPIKVSLLDQSIIVGIGNIYADEILFLSNINPLKKSNLLTGVELKKIIDNTRKVLEIAIKEGGTTIKSYTSSEGVTGHHQQNLLVHSKENMPCPVCNEKIIKIRVGGRGTYYCSKCQKG